MENTTATDNSTEDHHASSTNALASNTLLNDDSAHHLSSTRALSSKSDFDAKKVESLYNDDDGDGDGDDDDDDDDDDDNDDTTCTDKDDDNDANDSQGELKASTLTEKYNITTSPTTKLKLEKQQEEYMTAKNKLMQQRTLCRELLADATEIKDGGCPSCGRPMEEKEEVDDEGQTNKENVQKKGRGPSIMKRKRQRQKKVQELSKRLTELEAQNTETLQRLQKAKLLQTEDLDIITDLKSEVSQQKILIASLERRVKKKDDLPQINVLQAKIQSMNQKMNDMRRQHEIEKEELHIAYDELKSEASQLVEWLKTQLAEYQGKEMIDDIAHTKSEEEEDLESLTPSEKEALAKEIEEERRKWIDELANNSAERLDMPSFSGNLGKRSNSVDGSPLTDPMSPE